ncbi:MAG: hypothetical protein KAU90_11445, partial [Sulfurovaceae bacterium]|nr:hypothetical protein [Sulfurovaceae bacterium]
MNIMNYRGGGLKKSSNIYININKEKDFFILNFFLRILVVMLFTIITPIQIFALDTDGDGVENNIDLDDDNDGILDINEGYAHILVNNAGFEEPK